MSARYNLILLAKLTACYRGEGPMGPEGRRVSRVLWGQRVCTVQSDLKTILHSTRAKREV